MAAVRMDIRDLYIITIIVIGLLWKIELAAASNGDRSFIFGKCLQRCVMQNCSNVANFAQTQPLHHKILLWSCEDECKYNCMWRTVDAFQNDGSRVPQFYGKWPFVRFAGIQEPASMVFSLLNAVSHLAIFYYRAKVPSSTPMYTVWHGMALIDIVTWLCATIFHTRDTDLTERLDYFSAFGLVVYNVFTLLCRVIGTDRKACLTILASLLLGLYCYHIYYLAMIHFDYGYNMIVNVAVGLINGIGWIAWCARMFCVHDRTKVYYLWKCVFVIFGLKCLLALEIFDFPPLLWTFDAHAIWHAGTVPLTLLWYSFITDDALLLKSADEGSKDVKKMV